MQRLTKIAGILIFASLSNQALADCTQADMKGTWFISGFLLTLQEDTGIPLRAETEYCKLKVGSSGNLVGASSSCDIRASNGTSTLDVGGGKLIVNNTCGVRGFIRLCSAQCINLSIDNGRLDSQKTVLNLTAKVATAPQVIGAWSGGKR